MRILARASPFALIEDDRGDRHCVWGCPNKRHAIVEVYLDETKGELIIDPCHCGQEASPGDFSTALRQLIEQVSASTARSEQEGGALSEIPGSQSGPVLLPAPADYQSLTVTEENRMQHHTVNGEATEGKDSYEGEHGNLVTDLPQTVWETIRTRTFLVGATVGALLAYVGVRLAQAYLIEQSSDEPF